ncbi:MAG: hypothetical protein ACOX5R_02145 [bacterium]
MNIIAEVTEGGVLRIKSPELKPGDQICLQTRPLPDQENKGKWSEIKKALELANTLDFPRRSHEEILRALHEQRG